MLQKASFDGSRHLVAGIVTHMPGSHTTHVGLCLRALVLGRRVRAGGGESTDGPGLVWLTENLAP